MDKSDLNPLKRTTLGKRLSVNVLTLERCNEQKKRRRAMTNGLTGSQHFRILDKIIDKVMKGFNERMKKACD